MKVDVTSKITDINDTVVKDTNGEELLVRQVLMRAILTDFSTDKTGNSASDKLDRFELAMMIKTNDEVTLSEKEAEMIRERVARCFITQVAAPVIKLLK